MKAIFFFLFIIVSQSCHAQKNKDTIPDYDYLQRGNVSRIGINPIKVKNNKDSTSLIIIDNKIYKFGSKEITRFNRNKLILISTIIDTLSLSGITKILIYKTQ
jgi:hypothetical protein